MIENNEKTTAHAEHLNENDIVHRTGCLICGKTIVYSTDTTTQTCFLCGNKYESNAVCEDGHYVCDGCHASEWLEIIQLLHNTEEKDPGQLFERIVALDNIHMHGPEHHVVVPCVLLTAYKNNGGDIDLDKSLKYAIKRGSKVPGGICGLWGSCGAAISAGIYASIIARSTPLNADAWSIPQVLTSKCLEAIAEIGGPRCCKRTSRIAIETAVQFTKENFGVAIPLDNYPCTFHAMNKECIHERCPYYREHKDTI
jgi:hypothetical protein